MELSTLKDNNSPFATPSFVNECHSSLPSICEHLPRLVSAAGSYEEEEQMNTRARSVSKAEPHE